MARPTKPKDAKPKALEPVGDPGGGGSKSSSGMNMIVMAMIIVLCTTLSTSASMFGIYHFFIEPQLGHLAAAGSGDATDNGDNGDAPKAPTIGPVLDLDEFTVNLKST